MQGTNKIEHIEIFKRRLKRGGLLVDRLKRRGSHLAPRAEALVSRVQSRLDEILAVSTERDEILSYFLYIANRDERERRLKILRENARARAEGCPPWLLHPIDWE